MDSLKREAAIRDADRLRQPRKGVAAKDGEPERGAAVQFPPQARGRYRMTLPLKLEVRAAAIKTLAFAVLFLPVIAGCGEDSVPGI
jgi:hypothetical protein